MPIDFFIGAVEKGTGYGAVGRAPVVVGDIEVLLAPRGVGLFPVDAAVTAVWVGAGDFHTLSNTQLSSSILASISARSSRSS